VAMQKNHFGCVKKLLSYPETDVNCKDDNGRTLVSSSIDNLTEASLSHIKYLLKEKVIKKKKKLKKKLKISNQFKSKYNLIFLAR
jgi:hypothetical protein